LKEDAPAPRPTPDPTAQPEAKPEPSLQDKIKQALAEPQTPQAPKSTIRAEGALNASELDAVRQQIAGCWAVPAGARDADDLVIEMRVTVRPDRTVSSAELLNPEKGSDTFWRSAAERAIRAVRNPKCSPLKLPPDKYDVWNTIIFTFNPKEMLG
jgi:hypothetical protein